MSREILNVTINISSLFENRNGIVFTKEAIEDAMKNIIDKPITIIEEYRDINGLEKMSDKVIGVVKSAKDGYLWCEIKPEIRINELDNNVITSFELEAVSVKL